MTNKKITSAVVAAVTAALPFSSDALNVLVPTAVRAENTGESAQLPEWIPTDYQSALDFRNTYGTTHIENGLLCLVFKEDRECEHGNPKKDEPHYSFRAADGIMEQLKDDVYGTENCRCDYEVVVFEPKQVGDFDIALIDNWVKSASLEPQLGYVHYIGYYTFAVGDDLAITETDSFGWIPDCYTEYEDFKAANGGVSARDSYVVFCLDSEIGSPYAWQQLSTGAYNNFDLYDQFDCSEETEEVLDGGTQKLIKVFNATKDGFAEIAFEYTSYAQNENPGKGLREISADCAILDETKTVLLSGDVRVTVLDGKTGEPLDISPESGFALYRLAEDEKIADIASNPFILRSGLYPYTNRIDLKLPASYSENGCTAKKSTKTYQNGAMDVTFTLSEMKAGDVNGDGIFSISDVVTFQRWLLGDGAAVLTFPKAADFCNDDRLDTFDLCLMRKAVAEAVKLPVEVEIVEYGGVAGLHNVYTAARSGDRYTLSFEGRGGSQPARIVTLTDEEYREIMAVDYDKLVADYEPETIPIMDAIYCGGVLKYADGSEREVYDSFYPVYQRLEKLMSSKLDAEAASEATQ